MHVLRGSSRLSRRLRLPFLSARPRTTDTTQRARHRQRKFVDRCRVVLKGGDGGKGCIAHVHLSSKRPKTVDGGNGAWYTTLLFFNHF
jgi:hypothetical protein